VRNPPTTSHTPAAMEGATILVKLHQFDPADRTQVQIYSNAEDWAQGGEGVSRLALHDDDRETVMMERWAPGTTRRIEASGGLELLVIDGALTQGGDTLTRWDWLRLPVGSSFEAVAGEAGAQVWIKTGHLRHLGTFAA
jgi:anti-sigma factor ChrR (cupin superfamily)